LPNIDLMLYFVVCEPKRLECGVEIGVPHPLSLQPV
jgi:hypothetical protein